MTTSAAPDASQDLILRPVHQQRSASDWLAAGAGILSAACFSIRLHGIALVVTIAASLLLAFGLVVWLRSQRNHSQLALRGRTLFSGTPRERPVFEIGQPGEIVELTIDFGRGQRDAWALLDGAGRSRVFLMTQSWERSELEELRRRLGLSLSSRKGVYSARKTSQEFPGSIPPWLSRPGLVFGGATVLVIIVISVVASA